MGAPDVRVVPATLRLAELLAPRMRAEDRAEVLASGGYTPLDALLRSMSFSPFAAALLFDGEPAALFGCGPFGRPGVGVVWALTSDLVDRHPRAFLRASRAEIARMLDIYPELTNAVDCRYTRSIRWLAHLGAAFGVVVPFGNAGLPFLPFALRHGEAHV